MVITTRSAYRKACESSNSSDVSQKNIIPPWCSSGKVLEKRKLRKVSPSWEIQSSYPLRENIWEYLYVDKGESVCEKRGHYRARQKAKRRKGKTASIMFLTVLLAALGVMTSIWMNEVPTTNLLANVVSKEKIISLCIKSTPVAEECCHKMRYLAAELSRVEQALRNSIRIHRATTMATLPSANKGYSEAGSLVDGATVIRGGDTTEWGGRVALWGVVPLWRAAPPPDTVLALRKPTPSDCWPFSGTHGEIIIQLPRRTKVHSISVEHIQPDTAKSAPKHFILYGVLENGTWVNTVKGEYQRKGLAKQYFYLNWSSPLKQLVFRVMSNQGNQQYTCLYRVHIYGK